MPHLLATINYYGNYFLNESAVKKVYSVKGKIKSQ